MGMSLCYEMCKCLYYMVCVCVCIIEQRLIRKTCKYTIVSILRVSYFSVVYYIFTTPAREETQASPRSGQKNN